MRIHLKDLDAGEIRLQIAVDPQTLPTLANLDHVGEIGFATPLDLDLRIFRNTDMVTVLGRLATKVGMACARCLARHKQTLDFGFELSYLQSHGASAGGEKMAREVELDAREAGLIHFQDDSLDLAEGIAEQVIMRLPFKPLCQPDCKGLCSHCGINKNAETCTCGRHAAENPFAVLQQWSQRSTDD
ncbi:MAG: DUF177 domain-containing protein [Desulfosarcinaceae bacterium]|nr:DUF177 domain-containing protein [Desulfosarcinaceae bacterium]